MLVSGLEILAGVPGFRADGLLDLAGRGRGDPRVSSGPDTIGDPTPASGRYRVIAGQPPGRWSFTDHSRPYPYISDPAVWSKNRQGYHLKNEGALPSLAWLMSSVASAQSLVVINSGTLAIEARFSE